MHFTKLVFLPFIIALAMAAPAAEAEPEANTELLKRGFGCPFDRERCNTHVR